jgi:hypothetical protein
MFSAEGEQQEGVEASVFMVELWQAACSSLQWKQSSAQAHKNMEAQGINATIRAIMRIMVRFSIMHLLLVICASDSSVPQSSGKSK